MSMPKRRKPPTGGIPQFAITVPEDDYMDLVGKLRSTPGVESMCWSPTENGTQLIIVGATFKEVLAHVEEKAAIALQRIKLEEAIYTEDD